MEIESKRLPEGEDLELAEERPQENWRQGETEKQPPRQEQGDVPTGRQPATPTSSWHLGVSILMEVIRQDPDLSFFMCQHAHLPAHSIVSTHAHRRSRALGSFHEQFRLEFMDVISKRVGLIGAYLVMIRRETRSLLSSVQFSSSVVSDSL